MITPEYSRQSIEEFAAMIRKDLGLTPPITPDDMRQAYHRLGIKLTPKHNCSLDNIKRHAPFEYEVEYDPDWDNQKIVWKLSTTLGHILLHCIHKDEEKNVYTGDYECLTSEGYPEDINKVIHYVAQFEDSIKRCEDVSDIRESIHANIDKKSHLSYFVECAHDFHSDTLIHVQICGGAHDYEYYIRFPKVHTEIGIKPLNKNEKD